MGRRLTRKKLKQDEFVSVVDEALHWLAENWRPVAYGAGTLAVVGLLWWGLSAYSGVRTDKAALALHEAVSALEGEGSDPALAETRLREVVDRFGRTDQGDAARLYLARILLDREETDEARVLLSRVAARSGNDSLVRVATLDLIHLRIGAGQATEVAGELEAMIVGRDRSLPRDVALFELGSLYVKEQRFDEARKYLQMLVEEFPESPYVGDAQDRLRELGPA